ncbi:hypothetical protein ACF06T_30205 [Streptomyces albidoflavus]
MKDKQRKLAARQEQAATGRRYAAVAREQRTAVGQEPRPPRTVLLRELMLECLTQPLEIMEDDGDLENWEEPDRYRSPLLGGLIPRGTVLELVGLLAGLGQDARLTVESWVEGSLGVVVTEDGRRFELRLRQASTLELCRVAQCGSDTINGVIDRCHAHLAKASAEELVKFAQEWGFAQSDAEQNAKPARRQHDPVAELLVHVATARGNASAVAEAFVHHALEDPEIIDEAYWDEAEALEMHHAVASEKLRLRQLATAESRRLRGVLKRCAACGGDLPGHAELSFPPKYCSRECVPPAPQEPSPWDPPAGLPPF